METKGEKRLPPKRTFSTEEAHKAGLTKYAIKKMLENNELEKISRGYYRHIEDSINLDEEAILEIATAKVGAPSAVCLLSALIHYNLTDAIGRKVWIMVPASRRSSHRDLRLVRTRSPKWEIGIERHGGYSITSLERTLVDCLTHRRLVGSSEAINALRRAVEEKKTTLAKVLDMAKKLRVDHRILPYIEALS